MKLNELEIQCTSEVIALDLASTTCGAGRNGGDTTETSGLIIFLIAKFIKLTSFSI